MIKKWFMGLLFLLATCNGCGGGDETPAPPTYTESPESRELKALLIPKVKELTGLNYQDWLSRFIVPESPIRKSALEKYQSLFDTQTYDLTDYTKTEQEYLDTLLRKYGEAREEAWKPIQERLIGEHLFESGPGFGMQTEFGEETATGISDITKQWAYEGIQRKIQQQQYYDALKRGDYATMYQLALSEEARALQPIQLATEAELASISPGLSLFGEISGEDWKQYQSALNTYQALLAQQKHGSYAGLGTLLGTGIGALLALPTGGMSVLGGGMLGGLLGGGAGSMWNY